MPSVKEHKQQLLADKAALHHESQIQRKLQDAYDAAWKPLLAIDKWDDSHSDHVKNVAKLLKADKCLPVVREVRSRIQQSLDDPTKPLVIGIAASDKRVVFGIDACAAVLIRAANRRIRNVVGDEDRSELLGHNWDDLKFAIEQTAEYLQQPAPSPEGTDDLIADLERKVSACEGKRDLGWRDLEGKFSTSERTVRRWAKEIGYDLKKHTFVTPSAQVQHFLDNRKNPSI